MQLIPLKSQRVQSGSELVSVVVQALQQSESKLKDGDILVIASKVVAYSQGLLVKVEGDQAFSDLVSKESDAVIDKPVSPDFNMKLTLKNRILIPNAGIDNSNTPEGEVILWPEKPFEFARQFRQKLMQEFNLSEFGVVVSDSHCQPLREGTSGIAIGWAGFEGVIDERGAKDLFGREMAYTKLAVADNLCAASTLLMGETDASVPFVLVRDFEAEFNEKSYSEDDYAMSPSECIYNPLYSEALLNL